MLFCASLYLCLGEKKLASILIFFLEHLQLKEKLSLYSKFISEGLSMCMLVFQLKVDRRIIVGIILVFWDTGAWISKMIPCIPHRCPLSLVHFIIPSHKKRSAVEPIHLFGLLPALWNMFHQSLIF